MTDGYQSAGSRFGEVCEMYLKADGTIKPTPIKLKEINKADGPDVSLLATHDCI